LRVGYPGLRSFLAHPGLAYFGPFVKGGRTVQQVPVE
jgi:hypothetical protein